MSIPKLRFKEFNDEWQEKKLEDISNILSGKRIPKGLNSVNYNTGIPYITVSSMGDFFINEKEVQYITKEVEKYILKYKVKTNDIIVSVAGTLGKLNIVQKNLSGANLTENCDKITNIDDNSYYLYIYYYLKSCIDKYVMSLSTKSSQPKLALDRIRNITINLPSLEEQTKISNFLSLIDKKIELQTQLVNNLNLYKKGLLQKVFSNNQGWKSVKLGDICNIIKGTQLNKSNLLENSLYYCLNGGITPSGYTNNWNVKENTISISEGGNSCGYVNFNKSKFWSGGHCYSLQNVTINNKYLYQFLKFKEKNIMDLRVGTGLPNIQKSAIENFEIKYPSIEEQNRIANLFTNLDKKIDFETKKLENLKTYKKGLLQKMFI